jgi:ferritin-like metal-binding protein YciE
MAMDTLSDLMEDEIKDLYSAENQLLKALPKMAKKASSPSLKDAFTSHLKETEGHVKRIEKIGQLMGIKLSGKTCKAMKGLIEEGKEVLEEDGEPSLIDAALIGAAQRVEHYEMAAYGTTRAMAHSLGQTEIATLLQQTLEEEGAADKKLTKIALKEVLVEAAGVGDEETV